jgi:hypothetical protein|tara:strand:- start:1421 stop:2086 length:666 start_codon:yes stop_codon:yes gene_type:complete
MKKLEVNRQTILNLLESKSRLKQDVSQETQTVFKKLKSAIEKEIIEIKPSINDERVRLHAEEKGDNEVKVMIGSDALIFQMHSNVFRLPDDNAAWERDYLKNQEENGYFGVINIYNFLADSFIYNRLNDTGFLIGRIFINRESHILVEGEGQLGFLFKDPETNTSSSEILKHIIQCSFSHALDFDLIAPPYEMIQEISIGQILEISADLQMKTSKRMGFKQ